jgi:glycosyltransferase involved in cell wall biosynthesis
LATVPLAVSTVVHQKAWRELISAYICVSRSEREKLKPFGLPVDRVFVKTNLILDAEPGSASRKGELVVYMGRLTAIKGVQTLMRAWELHRAASPASELRLAIAGAGPLEADLMVWARTRPEVDLLGLLNPAECASLLNRASVAVVPSESEETFGLVALEAMRAGVAVIAAAHGALPELVTDGETGTLFAPGDVASLARILDEVGSSPGRYARYGENARIAYKTTFDPDANIDQLESIYRFAVENPAWVSRSGAAPTRDASHIVEPALERT